ncbi:uncharacterized protein EMH_0081930 [Eimeria mitis]|uniref:Transmembrane protein n=1 Tax=Eimeria mitis TaxID=44415 RepID=U6K5U1_9EIME|nr:uncharacterized protein EMH_0081930 [Eimeria mitis]CDJ33345.1 hypothetical protein, conserved [Eimeria mitis]
MRSSSSRKNSSGNCSNSSGSSSGTQDDKTRAINTSAGRGCALQLAAAVGSFVPSIILFQAHLGLLDGTSGPAGRAGEALLHTDLLLNFAVLLPVVLLLPAVLCPSIFYLLHCSKRPPHHGLKAATAPRPAEESRWRYRGLWVAAAAVAIAVAVAVAALNTSPVLLPPLVDVPLEQQQREAEGRQSAATRSEEGGTEGSVVPLLPASTEEELRQQQTHSQSKAHRSLLALLPFSLGHYILPSQGFPFSPERPLQLHFVLFRRAKITGLPSPSSSSDSSKRNDTDKGQDHASFATDTEEAAAATAEAGAAASSSTSRFAPELEPFSVTHYTPPLLRHSTQGVAVMGLGPQVFWNPAFADAPHVLSTVRSAMVAAEAAAAFGSLNETAETSSSCNAAATGDLKHINNTGTNSRDTTGEGAAAAAIDKNAVAAEKDNNGNNSGDNRTSRCSEAKPQPSFLLMEESPSQKAPLTLAHLHRLSTTRTHWSLYTDSQAFLPPPKPMGGSRVFSHGLRGELDIHYECVAEAKDETRLRLLIGGASLLALALPAAGLKRWNLERQAPLRRLQQCDCYIITLANPLPPVMTKLEFFFHGHIPVRFTTRSGLFDVTAPNTACAETPLFRAVQHFPAPPPRAQAEDDRASHLKAAPEGGKADGGTLYLDKASESGNPAQSPLDTFWERLLNALPPHIAAAGSYADAAEWDLPPAPFSAKFAFD